MGDFLIKIAATGGHGCNREAKQGEVFTPCMRTDCPDCSATKMVHDYYRQFPGMFSMGGFATLTHWPVELNKVLGRNYDEAHEVTDDLLVLADNKWLITNQRKRIRGSFR
jgi:hypothetical protein